MPVRRGGAPACNGPGTRTCRGSRTARRRRGRRPTRPSDATVTVAPSCFMRPSMVRLRGVASGSYGSSSTIQPNRFASFGCRPGRSARPSGSTTCRPLRDREAVAGVRLDVRRVDGSRHLEVLVEVLLAGQDRSPRGGAACAVVQRAEHPASGRVGRGLEQVVAGGRSGEDERRGPGDPPVERPTPGGDELPPAGSADPLDLGDGQPVGGQRDLELLLGGRRAVGPAAEHQDLVGVLVVDDEQRAVLAAVTAAERDDGRVVAVVAELLFLRRAGLVVEVERRSVRGERISPGRHDGLLEAVGDDERVAGVGCHGVEVEPVDTVAVVGSGARAPTGRTAAAAAGPAWVRPAPAPSTRAPVVPRTVRRDRADATTSPKYGLSVGLGTGWSQALPQRKVQVMRLRVPCRGSMGRRRFIEVTLQWSRLALMVARSRR